MWPELLTRGVVPPLARLQLRPSRQLAGWSIDTPSKLNRAQLVLQPLPEHPSLVGKDLEEPRDARIQER